MSLPAVRSAVTMNFADADSTDSTRLTIDSTESTSPLTEL